MKIQDLAALSRGMQKAYEASLIADHPTFRLGCAVMIKGKRVVAVGANHKYKSHPYVHQNGQWFNHGIHAEMSAIFKIKNKDLLQGAVVYIFRQTKNGEFANARPCSMCYDLIKQYGVKKIVFTVENGIMEERVK